MDRYKFTRIIKSKDTGNRVYKSTFYPKIKIENTDKFVYPIDGDRLENVAHRYYGDATLWWIIAQANNIRDGSFGLKPDKQIRIPIDIDPIINKLENMAF